MDQANLFFSVFEDSSLSFSCKTDRDVWEFLWTFPERPDENTVEEQIDWTLEQLGFTGTPYDYKIEALPDRDWLAESYRALPPFSVGSFFIYGSHYAGAIPPAQIPLLIEAATAFGSGEHGTTAQCILAIEHVKNSAFRPRNILDMGCGSGILAAAAAKLWPDVPIDAADNDPECIKVTKRHMEANGITNVTAFSSEGYEAESPARKNAPYDFIIANILAAPLIEMAGEQSNALAKGGYLILSGTLAEQATRVIAAYEAQGLKLVAEFPQGEWMTMLMRK